MIGGEFKLCFADIEIAEVQHKESDFPNDFGSWTPLPLSVDVELHRHLREYIAYSIESSRLLDETNAGPEWEDFIGREESRYLDLIEAETWYLVDSSGGRTSILIPIFHHDGGLVWRWNTARFGDYDLLALGELWPCPCPARLRDCDPRAPPRCLRR